MYLEQDQKGSQQFDINTIARSTGFRAKARQDSFGDMQRQKGSSQVSFYHQPNYSQNTFGVNLHDKPRSSLGYYNEHSRSIIGNSHPSSPMKFTPERKFIDTPERTSQIMQNRPLIQTQFRLSNEKQNMNQYGRAGSPLRKLSPQRKKSPQRNLSPSRSLQQFKPIISTTLRQNYFPSSYQQNLIQVPPPKKVQVQLGTTSPTKSGTYFNGPPRERPPIRHWSHIYLETQMDDQKRHSVGSMKSRFAQSQAKLQSQREEPPFSIAKDVRPAEQTSLAKERQMANQRQQASDKKFENESQISKERSILNDSRMAQERSLLNDSQSKQESQSPERSQNQAARGQDASQSKSGSNYQQSSQRSSPPQIPRLNLPIKNNNAQRGKEAANLPLKPGQKDTVPSVQSQSIIKPQKSYLQGQQDKGDVQAPRDSRVNSIGSQDLRKDVKSDKDLSSKYKQPSKVDSSLNQSQNAGASDSKSKQPQPQTNLEKKVDKIQRMVDNVERDLEKAEKMVDKKKKEKAAQLERVKEEEAEHNQEDQKNIGKKDAQKDKVVDKKQDKLPEKKEDKSKVDNVDDKKNQKPDAKKDDKKDSKVDPKKDVKKDQTADVKKDEKKDPKLEDQKNASKNVKTEVKKDDKNDKKKEDVRDPKNEKKPDRKSDVKSDKKKDDVADKKKEDSKIVKDDKKGDRKSDLKNDAKSDKKKDEKSEKKKDDVKDPKNDKKGDRKSDVKTDKKKEEKKQDKVDYKSDKQTGQIVEKSPQKSSSKGLDVQQQPALNKSVKLGPSMNILTSYFKKQVAEQKSEGRSSVKKKPSEQATPPKTSEKSGNQQASDKAGSIKDSPGKASLKVDKQKSGQASDSKAAAEPKLPQIDEENKAVMEYIKKQKKKAADPTKDTATLRKYNQVWRYFDPKNPKICKDFPDQVAVLLESYYNFNNSKSKKSQADQSNYQNVRIDALRTVDLGQMKLRIIHEDSKYNQVLQVQRVESKDKERATTFRNRMQNYEETVARDGEDVFHWLPLAFLSKNRKPGNVSGLPSWKQVIDGLVAEETAQIMLETRGKEEDRRLAILKRAQGAWDLIFCLLGINIDTTPIDRAALQDLNHPTTQAVLQIYALETWLQAEINKANQAQDSSKLQTLGPFGSLISCIMDHSQAQELKKPLEVLYKPINYDQSKVAFLDEYKSKKGKVVHFSGIVSATTDKMTAVKYLSASQEKPVILQMELGTNSQDSLLSLDSSNYTSYPQDFEVLMNEGIAFSVTDLTKEQIAGKQVTIIKLRCSGWSKMSALQIFKIQGDAEERIRGIVLHDSYMYKQFSNSAIDMKSIDTKKSKQLKKLQKDECIVGLRQYLDGAGQLTQVDFETNQDRVLTLKGTNASDNDEMGEVLEVPPNKFVFAVWQAQPYGPITSIDTVQLPQHLQTSNGHFQIKGDKKATLCEFRDSEFIPFDLSLMNKKATVLADGYCHAPGWAPAQDKSMESVFIYDSISDQWNQYSVKDTNYWKEIPKKGKPIATWERVEKLGMGSATTISDVKLWSVTHPKYALELKGGIDMMPVVQKNDNRAASPLKFQCKSFEQAVENIKLFEQKSQAVAFQYSQESFRGIAAGTGSQWSSLENAQFKSTLFFWGKQKNMPKKQGLTCFGIDSVDFSAQVAGQTWDDVKTEQEALDIIRKRGDLRKGDAYAYHQNLKKLITRPCKLGGEFAHNKNSTLYMFGEAVPLSSGQQSADAANKGADDKQKKKWKEEKLIIN